MNTFETDMGCTACSDRTSTLKEKIKKYMGGKEPVSENNMNKIEHPLNREGRIEKAKRRKQDGGKQSEAKRSKAKQIRYQPSTVCI